VEEYLVVGMNRYFLDEVMVRAGQREEAAPTHKTWETANGCVHTAEIKALVVESRSK
jgi:hypothetical protein